MKKLPKALPYRFMALLLGCVAGVASAQEPVVLHVDPTVTPEAPAAIGGRYDGFLFLDSSGRPVPFQSDVAIEEYLAAAKIESMNKISVGVTNPRKLVLEDDGIRVHAVFKDIDRQEKNIREKTGGKSRFYFIWRDWFGYDIAAYHVDRLLALDRVPPTVERTVKGQQGSVQIWIEGVITRSEKREAEFKPPDLARWNQQKAILYIFDSLVANRDSNLGNGLIDENWRLWFTDCSRCFSTTEDLLYVESITHCERRLWTAIRDLDPGLVRERLEPYLSRSEIDSLLIRRDKLVEHIQGLIDESSEFLILFDVRPASEKAPWRDSEPGG